MLYLDDDLLNDLGDITTVSNASHASETNNIESNFVQEGLESTLLQVLGDHTRSLDIN